MGILDVEYASNLCRGDFCGMVMLNRKRNFRQNQKRTIFFESGNKLDHRMAFSADLDHDCWRTRQVAQAGEVGSGVVVDVRSGPNSRF